MVIVQLDRSLNRLVLHVDLREVENPLHIKRIVHVQMNPEERLLVVCKDFAVELNILLLGALIWMFCPQRMNLIQRYRTFPDLELWHLLLGRFCAVLSRDFLLLLKLFYNDIILSLLLRIDGFKLLRCICLLKINLIRHEGAVFFDDLSCLVLIAELKTVLVEKQCNLCTNCGSVSVCHRKLCAAVALPVYGRCILFIRECINMHRICHHKCRIKTKSEMANDLIVISLVFVFLDEICRTGKSDLVDVLLHLVRGHAKSGINKLECLLLWIDNDMNILLHICRILILSHHLKFF